MTAPAGQLVDPWSDQRQPEDPYATPTDGPVTHTYQAAPGAHRVTHMSHPRTAKSAVRAEVQVPAPTVTQTHTLGPGSGVALGLTIAAVAGVVSLLRRPAKSAVSPVRTGPAESAALVVGPPPRARALAPAARLALPPTRPIVPPAPRPVPRLPPVPAPAPAPAPRTRGGNRKLRREAASLGRVSAHLPADSAVSQADLEHLENLRDLARDLQGSSRSEAESALGGLTVADLTRALATHRATLPVGPEVHNPGGRHPHSGIDWFGRGIRRSPKIL